MRATDRVRDHSTPPTEGGDRRGLAGLPASDYAPAGGVDPDHPHLFHLQSATSDDFDGGSLQGARSGVWPILTDQKDAVYLARLRPGGAREPHWHPSAWEMNVVLSGRVRWSFVGPNSTGRVRGGSGGRDLRPPRATSTTSRTPAIPKTGSCSSSSMPTPPSRSTTFRWRSRSRPCRRTSLRRCSVSTSRSSLSFPSSLSARSSSAVGPLRTDGRRRRGRRGRAQQRERVVEEFACAVGVDAHQR
ncbi:MAG: hypothetical protein DI577_03200, partial [Microbacterium sp.]